MSEATGGLIGTVGASVRGGIGGHPACGSCAHVHRVTDRGKVGNNQDIALVYDIACPEPGCYCTASGDAYDRGIVDVPVPSAWAKDERWCADNGVRPAITTGDLAAYCGSGDAIRESGMDEGPALRGTDHRVDDRGSGLFGWAWDQQRELGRLWRTAVRILRGTGDTRPADSSGDADPVEPTRSERLLRELVNDG